MATEIYDDNSLYATDKLGMVNQCLIAINQTPLPTGTVLADLDTGTDAQIARDIVAYTMREVQTRGWFFNTDRNFSLLPDSNGFIALPENLLRFDVGDSQDRGMLVIKGNKIYNRYKQDYTFDRPVVGTAVWLTDYSDLPVTAYQYIALRSARIFQQRVVGSKELYAFNVQDEIDAFTNLQREELQYNDYNLFDSRVTSRFYNPTWGQ